MTKVNRSTIWYACTRKHGSVAMILLDHADIDVNVLDIDGTNALTFAKAYLDNSVDMRMVSASMRQYM